jgi:spoIIIJ-associated protein
MKKTKEFSGKDVDTAVKTACSTLSVSKKELKYEVISTGASGIFGIVGRKDAVIKVVLPQNNTGTSDKDMEGIRSMVDEAFGQDTRTNGPAPGKKPGRPVNETPVTDAAPEPEHTPETAPQKDPDPEKTAGPQKTAALPRPAAKPAPAEPENTPAPQKEPAQAAQAPSSEHDAVDDPYDAVDDQEPDLHTEPSLPLADPVPVVDVTQQSIDLGIQTLQKMADLITEDATVEAETNRDHLTLKISGGNAGILIGRKGQTLDAMQFLTDKIINRQSEARVRVKVDVEGYIETRKSNLRHLALKMAEKAKKTGRPATINQMSAQDRRIVHLALKDDNRVRTQSMGDGYYRRLVIFPKKKNAFAGKKRFKR